VLEAIELGERFNPELEVILVGISIRPPRSLGEGLSEQVAASVGEAVRCVTRLIEIG
jgi:hypothetical protein